MGLWAPSSERCAQLAAAELNDYQGILGKEVHLHLVDSSGSPLEVARKASDLLVNNRLDAIVGMHASDVRQALVQVVAGRIPYIYTPMYEGKESHACVYTTGDTPEYQVKPIIGWLEENFDAHRWYFIGNDYVWPRVSNSFAKDCLHRNPANQIVGEEYVSLSTEDYAEHLDNIENLQPDVVVVNLLGDCSIQFNRQFGERGLDRDIIRYCGAIEENMLYAIGAEYTKNMYSAMSYYADLETQAARGFCKYYYASFGQEAPALNQFAVSCYEGIMLLSELSKGVRSMDAGKMEAKSDGYTPFSGPRGELYSSRHHTTSAMHIVKANGLFFEHVESFAF
jgi:ABC-type branched-subunit amino acid transport system substrate-binding protein